MCVRGNEVVLDVNKTEVDMDDMENETKVQANQDNVVEENSNDTESKLNVATKFDSPKGTKIFYLETIRVEEKKDSPEKKNMTFRRASNKAPQGTAKEIVERRPRIESKRNSLSSLGNDNEILNLKLIKKHNKDFEDNEIIDFSLQKHFFLKALKKNARFY